MAQNQGSVHDANPLLIGQYNAATTWYDVSPRPNRHLSAGDGDFMMKFTKIVASTGHHKINWVGADVGLMYLFLSFFIQTMRPGFSSFKCNLPRVITDADLPGYVTKTPDISLNGRPYLSFKNRDDPVTFYVYDNKRNPNLSGNAYVIKENVRLASSIPFFTISIKRNECLSVADYMSLRTHIVKLMMQGRNERHIEVQINSDSTIPRVEATYSHVMMLCALLDVKINVSLYYRQRMLHECTCLIVAAMARNNRLSQFHLSCDSNVRREHARILHRGILSSSKMTSLRIQAGDFGAGAADLILDAVAAETCGISNLYIERRHYMGSSKHRNVVCTYSDMAPYIARLCNKLVSFCLKFNDERGFYYDNQITSFQSVRDKQQWIDGLLSSMRAPWFQNIGADGRHSHFVVGGRNGIQHINYYTTKFVSELQGRVLSKSTAREKVHEVNISICRFMMGLYLRSLSIQTPQEQREFIDRQHFSTDGLFVSEEFLDPAIPLHLRQARAVSYYQVFSNQEELETNPVSRAEHKRLGDCMVKLFMIALRRGLNEHLHDSIIFSKRIDPSFREINEQSVHMIKNYNTVHQDGYMNDDDRDQIKNETIAVYADMFVYDDTRNETWPEFVRRISIDAGQILAKDLELYDTYNTFYTLSNLRNHAISRGPTSKIAGALFKSFFESNYPIYETLELVNGSIDESRGHVLDDFALFFTDKDFQTEPDIDMEGLYIGAFNTPEPTDRPSGPVNLPDVSDEEEG
jgi:hypothetical protein